MKTKKIVGIKIATSKDGKKKYFTYYWVGAHKDYDLEHAECYGNTAGEDSSAVDIGAQVGDEVIFYYEKGYEDKATLVGCQIVKPAK